MNNFPQQIGKGRKNNEFKNRSKSRRKKGKKKSRIDKNPLHQSIPHQKYFPSLIFCYKASPTFQYTPPIRHFFFTTVVKKNKNNVIMSFDLTE